MTVIEMGEVKSMPVPLYLPTIQYFSPSRSVAHAIDSDAIRSRARPTQEKTWRRLLTWLRLIIIRLRSVLHGLPRTASERANHPSIGVPITSGSCAILLMSYRSDDGSLVLYTSGG